MRVIYNNWYIVNRRQRRHTLQRWFTLCAGRLPAMFIQYHGMYLLSCTDYSIVAKENTSLYADAHYARADSLRYQFSIMICISYNISIIL